MSGLLLFRIFRGLFRGAVGRASGEVGDSEKSTALCESNRGLVRARPRTQRTTLQVC